ncbi:MAG: hypothetical protein KF681_06730 [Bdellovibrionaceae bacterium]|nr:hypothetical protein [Pseudobdellovibrionaceae bacterium]
MGRNLALGAFFILAFGLSAEARVFQIGEESFAAYLRGQYGLAGQKDEPFAPASGAGSKFSDEYKTNMSYEFGFVYATPKVSLRIGFEFLKPADLKDMKGTDSGGGTEYYSVSNNISGFIPKVGVELNFKQWAQSRLFASANYGMATVTVQNSYTFTPAGVTAYPTPGADFREEIKGDGSLVEGSLGFETLLSDSTTIVLDAGYRTLEVGSFKHNVDSKGFQGNVSKGDTAKNTNGSDRTLNLNGGFVGLMIRVWIK